MCARTSTNPDSQAARTSIDLQIVCTCASTAGLDMGRSYGPTVVARRDRKAYDHARYFRRKAEDAWIAAGCPESVAVTLQPTVHEARNQQRPEEDDEAYLKRIHRNAKRLHQKDPDACRRLFPKWSPKKAQTAEQRRAKNAVAMKATRARKRDARTKALRQLAARNDAEALRQATASSASSAS